MELWTLLDVCLLIFAIATVGAIVEGMVNARFDGWNKLAARYRERVPFAGEVVTGMGGALTDKKGKNCVVGFNREGIGLRASGPLRPLGRYSAHPPLFIPWSEMTARLCDGTGGVDIEFRGVEGVRLMLTGTKAGEVQSLIAGGVHGELRFDGVAARGDLPHE